MTDRESLASERTRMGAVVDAFNKLARDMVACETMLAGWLPCRAAIEVVCGMDWSRLGHGTKTRVGSWLRDAFAEAYGFELTPVRLLRKTSGKGSHMIAVYPIEWLVANRDAMLTAIGEASAASPLLPFPDEADND